MGNYSKKQELFAKYMLNQFGIDDDDFVSKFLQYYAYSYGVYVQYESGTYFNCSESINQLIIEKKLRRDRYSIKLKDQTKNYISATDLSNFTYCPSSFAISNTFQIEYPTGEKEREVGEKLHEHLKLIQRVNDYKTTGNIAHKLFDEPIVLDILKSENVYVGHKDNRKTFFNKELNIACEPDYIFKDGFSNHFVVEEKFQYKKDPRKETYEDKWLEWNGYYSASHDEDRMKEIEDWDNSKVFFYPNHQVQLITYLKSITEYDLKYGYLVYWYYDYKNNQEPYIHKVSTRKITLADWSLRLFDTAYLGVKNLKTNKSSQFATDKINPNKCGGCVVNKYCGHKSKKYNDLTFPYNKEYLKFFKADFPEELKKNT